MHKRILSIHQNNWLIALPLFSFDRLNINHTETVWEIAETVTIKHCIKV
jgi:hypothetical protein